MAQFGSSAAASVKVFTVSGKKNEWTSATPRSNFSCAGGVQEVLKLMRPTSWAAATVEKAPAKSAIVNVLEFVFMACFRGCRAGLPGIAGPTLPPVASGVAVVAARGVGVDCLND